MRWICTKLPLVCAGSPGLLEYTLVLGRMVVPQVPMVASGSPAACSWPSAVSSVIGTSMAIGVDVEAGHVVGSEVVDVVLVLGVAQHAGDAGVEAVGAQVEGVEGGAEIDPEGIFHGAGEDPDAVAQVVDPLVGQGRVVGHGARAGVGRHRVKSLALGKQGALGAHLAAAQQRHGVGLAQAEALGTRTVEGGDRGRDDRGVPGGTGAGEFSGAGMPSPAPTRPWKTPGRRISVWNWNSKATSRTASKSLSILMV